MTIRENIAPGTKVVQVSWHKTKFSDTFQYTLLSVTRVMTIMMKMMMMTMEHSRHCQSADLIQHSCCAPHTKREKVDADDNWLQTQSCFSIPIKSCFFFLFFQNIVDSAIHSKLPKKWDRQTKKQTNKCRKLRLKNKHEQIKAKNETKKQTHKQITVKLYL